MTLCMTLYDLHDTLYVNYEIRLGITYDNAEFDVAFIYQVSDYLTEVISAEQLLKIMDTKSLMKGSVKEYLGSRTQFRSIELSVDYSMAVKPLGWNGCNFGYGLEDEGRKYGQFRVRVCTYQGQPLYIIENKVNPSTSYVEVIALQDLTAATFMITVQTQDEQVLERMELRYEATKQRLHSHDLILRGTNLDLNKSLVEQYLNVIAVSIAPNVQNIIL